MVSAISSANPSVRYINEAANNIQTSTANIASGTNQTGLYTAPNVSTSYTPQATTDTADLQGITNPDDPTNSNPPNVSYNQIGPTTSTTTDNGNDADIGAESTNLSTASAQLSLSVDAAKHKNDEKKQILDILA